MRTADSLATMRRVSASALLLSYIFITGCGSTVNPAAPTSGLVAPPQTGNPAEPGVDPDRVDEGGGGGGGACGPVALCGDVFLQSGDANLLGLVTVSGTGNPLNFSVASHIGSNSGDHGQSGNPSPGGHVLGAFLDLSVTDSLANVHVTFDLPSGKTVTVSDTAPAAQTIDTCNSRYALIFVTTNVTVQLKYLGKTEIKVYYFAACTP